ncbi:hypothetical protein RFI_31259 [Reticulomyxa filosa]|uniref:Uncharacterized protein n=1 Tax=Reticulomyxa filosa TaxID=46433 RepID=X6LXN4_RETFI|nr:hypothetical protein RFI_31259 [Reticulomyxa filosa]|eukprot:ETO06136.1 hypothetical protein RFI_31259 [Reticulomyxa filosa]
MIFLSYRIFLLFEIFYEKGLKELQVQLTTYWDYIIAMKLHYICPDLLDDWSWNMVDRLTPISSSNREYFEMNLVIDHEDHSIYLSLCKISTYILIRIDNRWIKTIPSDTHLNKIESTGNRDCTLIKPYLVVYFPCNDINVRHKEWLKNYIKNGFILRNNKSNEVMKYLYCSDIFTREGKLPSIDHIILLKVMQKIVICKIIILDIEFVWVISFMNGFVIEKVKKIIEQRISELYYFMLSYNFKAKIYYLNKKY